MGGGPDKERMVIVLWDDKPTDIIDEIQKRFPYIEVDCINFSNSNKPTADTSSRVPKELYQRATIWVTLANLPPTPDDVPNLKYIHLFSAGVDHFAQHPIVKNSTISITTSSGISAPPIAEWVLMTTLAATKHFAVTYEQQKDHVWGSNKMHLTETRDWVGKRIGIAGYGSIGRQVARLFTALGSTVIAYTASPRPTQASRADHGYIVPNTGDADGTLPSAWYSGTDKTSLHTFLSQSLDLLVISLPLTASTTHLFSTEEFRILSSRRAYIVNISRGKIIDQPALVEALNQEKLRGAMLDVADPEPLPKDDPLWDAKNVIITPHISSLGQEYIRRAYDVLMTNLERRERGEKMFNLVDRKKGY